ncbi:hypothetical protein TRICI_003139 [Trichomonascus ciferrii]|uniref:RRM domain-containing protein n=1 Tax=Trichomonascus ciferrii TaxID=44093 RepID=A0A642V4L4_9ASCO|nr:hypothetical protein TRICI_003139 [Trichomonascus ciferrii]
MVDYKKKPWRRQGGGDSKPALAGNSLFNRIDKNRTNKKQSPKSKKLENNPLYRAINNKPRPASAQGIPRGPRGTKVYTKKDIEANDYNRASRDDTVRRNAEGKMSFKGSHSRNNNNNYHDGSKYRGKTNMTTTNTNDDNETPTKPKGQVGNRPKLEFSIKHAALPPIVQIKNLEPGTSAGDVRTILEYVGPVSDTRAQYEPDSGTVTAEVVFESKEHSFIAVDQFNGSVADGREITAGIIKIHHIPEGTDSPYPPAEAPSYQPPAYVSSWEGPPLYSDTVSRRSRPVRQ